MFAWIKKLFGRGGLPKGEPIPMAVGMEAEKLHAQGNLRGALAVYERFLANHPDSAHGLNNAADLLLELEEAQRAKEFLERSLVIDPEYESALCNLAAAKGMLKDFVGARDTFERVLKTNPRSFTARMGLGGMFMDLKDGRMACQYLSEAVRLRPRHQVAWHNLGHAKILAGDLDGAEEAFKRLLAIDSKSDRGQQGLLRVRQLKRHAAKYGRVLACYVCKRNYVERQRATMRETALGGALCRHCGKFYCEPCVARAIHSSGASMRCACGRSQTFLGEAEYLRFEGFEELVVFRDRE